MVVTGILESLALKGGSKLAAEVLEWSRGSEAEQLVKLLKRDHPAARKLLLQPDCLLELRLFATAGQFDREHMLAAVAQVEGDPASAQALVAAIESTQWRTKRAEGLVHFEIAKLRFDVRQELNATTKVLLDRLEELGPRTVVPPTVPHQLPRVAASFTDRVEERRRLADALRATGGDASAKVVEIHGMPGVGKSVLAVRVGHDVSDNYPDGQLYENLRAADGTVVALGDALANLLRALGVAEDMLSSRTEARAALLRTQLASRSMLLVLDNVLADTHTIATLIPATPKCGVIVTSFTPVAGMDSDERVLLGELAEDDAVLLLERLAGKERIALERDAAAELVARCGSLPLALHAVAGWLKRSPLLTLAEAVTRLSSGNLDHSLQQAFALPYSRLTAGAASLFRTLGAVRTVVVSPGLASALAAHGPRDTERLVEEIVEAGLAERERDGMRLHELIHRFAAEKLRERPAEEALASECLAAWMLEQGERRALILGDKEGHDG